MKQKQKKKVKSKDQSLCSEIEFLKLQLKRLEQALEIFIWQINFKNTPYPPKYHWGSWELPFEKELIEKMKQIREEIKNEKTYISKNTQ